MSCETTPIKSMKDGIAPEFLLVDIGNTFVKLRLATRERLLGSTETFSSRGLGGDAEAQAQFTAWLRAYSGPPRWQMVLSCVVPGAASVVGRTLGDGETVVAVSPEQTDHGIDLSGYTQRSTLGADRIANMVGAVARHGTGRAMIVADFGTVATFNVLASGARFLGGVIAPGLDSTRSYFGDRTPALPALGSLILPPSAIGTSTREAMLAGAVLGYRGLVREILSELKREVPEARVIATGGAGDAVGALAPGLIDIHEPELTLYGLQVIGTRACSRFRAL